MYIIFGGEKYYTQGGAYDILAVIDDLARAKEFALSAIGNKAKIVCSSMHPSCTIEWSHVWCSDTQKIVEKFGVEHLN